MAERGSVKEVESFKSKSKSERSNTFLVCWIKKKTRLKKQGMGKSTIQTHYQQEEGSCVLGQH
jgi:hypothetical protein